MTLLDIGARTTGEGSMAKYTGSQDRPSRDEIARLAYQFYERRGRRDGDAVDDWLSAEEELSHHYRSAKPRDCDFVADLKETAGLRVVTGHCVVRS